MTAVGRTDPTVRAVGCEAGVGARVEAVAPGRVNLIGDHTDYSGGLALPMAVHLGTTVRGERGGDSVVLSSPGHPDAVVPLDVGDPSAIEPPWARYVAGVVRELEPTVGLRGTVTSTVPEGSGLSSSAALELAVALALGFTGEAATLARLCQRAEQVASGVPCGLMDQLTSACGIHGSALLLDLRDETVSPVGLPDGLEVVVVHSGQERRLSGSAYAERRAACEAVHERVGPLRDLSIDDLRALHDPTLVRRARHVVSENQRVLDAVAAMAAGDLERLGALALDSHHSLRDDYDVSTPVLDQLVEHLCAQPGVLGARLTGAGFGGCVVALAHPGALSIDQLGRAWVVRPGGGARVAPA